jgi:vacuolar-type H+-ATPase subunit I/STV1
MKTTRLLKSAGIVVLLVTLSPRVIAQKASPTPNKPEEIRLKEDTAAKVVRLLQERDALQEQVVGWQSTIEALQDRLEAQQGVQKDLERQQGELADLKKKQSLTAQETEKISQLQDHIQGLTESLKTDGSPASLEQEISRVEEQIRDAKARIASLVSQLTGTLAPEQYFKQTISLIYAGLIATVIVGFFVVALRDEKVRSAIFAPESGIQFVTLFSLVIAIILFGISGILEGKELSALLGGLSGYILGRGRGQSNPANATTTGHGAISRASGKP